LRSATTFTGEIDPVKDINNLLPEYKKEKSWEIPIHIDAASCGFKSPFTLIVGAARCHQYATQTSCFDRCR